MNSGPWAIVRFPLQPRAACPDCSMPIDQLHRYLDEPSAAEPWLHSLGVVNISRAHANLVNMATVGADARPVGRLSPISWPSICPPPAIPTGR